MFTSLYGLNDQVSNVVVRFPLVDLVNRDSLQPAGRDRLIDTFFYLAGVSRHFLDHVQARKLVRILMAPSCGRSVFS